MCVTCGCNIPDDDHGDRRNLTLADLRGAADAAESSVPQVVGNIVHALSRWRGRRKALAKEAELASTGTVLKADDEKRFLLLVSYSANKMPKVGADGYADVATPEVLEKACWQFMDNGAHVGLWHKDGTRGAARVVENYQYRNPVPWVIESPDGTAQVIKQGDWLTGVICTPATWAQYKARGIGGASPQGTCRRRPASPELLKHFQE